MADLQQLEEQIVGLSLLDAAQLVKKLEERLGVSAAAAAPVAPAGVAAAAAVASAAARAWRVEGQVFSHNGSRMTPSPQFSSTRTAT